MDVEIKNLATPALLVVRLKDPREASSTQTVKFAVHVDARPFLLFLKYTLQGCSRFFGHRSCR